MCQTEWIMDMVDFKCGYVPRIELYQDPHEEVRNLASIMQDNNK
jgi:hypothetical protein